MSAKHSRVVNGKHVDIHFTVENLVKPGLLMFQNRLCLRKGTYLASAYLEYYCKKCFASTVRCKPRAALP